MDPKTLYCKNCRANVPTNVWDLHESRCGRMCWYCEKCKTVMHRDLRIEHQKEHADIECECGILVPVDELPTHVLICPNREIPCRYCEYPELAKNLEEHEIMCGNKTEPCDKCGIRIKLVDTCTHCCADKMLPELSEMVICPFCDAEQLDLTFLQEHIFSEHSEIS